MFTGHDKWVGRLRAPQTRNHYAYVLNNPATLKDHLGYDPIEISPTGQVTDWNAISPASVGYADNWYDPAPVAPVVDYGSGPAGSTASYTPTTDYGGSSYSTDGYTNYTPTSYITSQPTQTPAAASQYQIPTTHLTQWGGGDSSSSCGPDYNPCSAAEYQRQRAEIDEIGSKFSWGEWLVMVSDIVAYAAIGAEVVATFGGAVSAAGAEAAAYEALKAALRGTTTNPEAEAAATRLSISEKIAGQMAPRGWSETLIKETVSKPATKHPVWDFTTGTRQAATAYARSDGSYVVVNDATGAVVQVSDIYKVGWKPVWETPRFQR